MAGLTLFVSTNLSLASTKSDELPKPPKFTWSGYLKNETAYRLHEPRTYTKIRNILYIESKTKADSSAELHINGRYYYDHVYDLFDYHTVSGSSRRYLEEPLVYVEGLPEEKDSNILELREVYLDIFGKNSDLRLGKQFIVWGILTGVRVIDEINPLNFRELLTPALLDYREPLWSARLDIYQGSTTYEFIAIPDLTFHLPAPGGSEWELFQEVPGTVYPQTHRPKNWEFGARVMRPIEDFDVSLSYFYTWDDFPVLFREAEILPTGIEQPEFFPRYTRMHMLGSTVQHPVGPLIFKLESVYVRGKYFGLSAIDRDNDGYLDHQGVIERDHIRYGLGIDFNAWKSDISLVATQWYIFNYDEYLIQDQLDTSLNIYIRSPVAKRSGVFELLGIYLVNLDEIYLKPKFSFRPTNRLEISVGMDLMTGEKSRSGVIAIEGKATELKLVAQSEQFIGNFDKHDRVFTEFKYSF